MDMNTALQIDTLRSEGKSIREIAELLKISKSQIQRYIKGEVKLSVPSDMGQMGQQNQGVPDLSQKCPNLNYSSVPSVPSDMGH